MSEKEIILLLQKLQEQVRKLSADVRSLQDGRPQGLSDPPIHSPEVGVAAGRSN